MWLLSKVIMLYCTLKYLNKIVIAYNQKCNPHFLLVIHVFYVKTNIVLTLLCGALISQTIQVCGQCLML